MNFIKFIVGGLLVFGSLGFGALLILGTPFALLDGNSGFWGLVIFGVIDLVILLSGIYLIRSTRR